MEELILMSYTPEEIEQQIDLLALRMARLERYLADLILKDNSNGSTNQ